MIDKIIDSMERFIKNYKIYLDLTCLLPNNFYFKSWNISYSCKSLSILQVSALVLKL